MPPPAVASGAASSSFGLCDRVATIFEAFEESKDIRSSVKGLFVDGIISAATKGRGFMLCKQLLRATQTPRGAWWHQCPRPQG